MKDNLVLWVAQGFGLGRVPTAPGTWGSLLGLGWFALLAWPQNGWWLAIGTALGLMLSVWCCGQAERILGQTDPGSVVLDEVAALPVCFLPFLLDSFYRTGSLPASSWFFSKRGLLVTVPVFLLFRFFDIAKPWPIRGSQKLPGGWGVTVDDLLAAIFTAMAAYALFHTVERWVK